MRNKEKNSGTHRQMLLIISVLLTFCILASVVFTVSKRITKEMSESAINNLTDSLNLFSNTLETILKKETEMQRLIAQEIQNEEDPNAFILSYEKNDTIVKMSLILSGETEGISDTGEVFTEEGLDFSQGNTVEGLPMSQSYLNSMGTWAYTLKCPVVKGTKEIATLYAEYVYNSLDEVLPKQFYDSEAKLYLMDAASERMVLKPKGMGEREAGHLNLEDFYHANKILEEGIKERVSECIRDGIDVMFYHDIQNEDSLIYMWSVNEGALYLIGYVPVQAIQREGDAVNQNIYSGSCDAACVCGVLLALSVF